MTLLRILGIDKYTTSFKTWISNKFIAKGGLKTINNESIEGKGNIEVQANAEMVLPESVGLTNIETTNESRVIRAFYNIQNDEFTIGDLRSETQPLHFWLLNKASALGQILNITIKDGEVWMCSCVAEIILNPIVNVQFDYLDTHYTLTWNADTQSWDVTKTPINTGAGIDPVIWKYLCNPYEVYVAFSNESDPIPEDLFNIINNNPNIAQKVIVINYENSAGIYTCHITGRLDNTFFISVEDTTYNVYIGESRTVIVESRS